MSRSNTKGSDFERKIAKIFSNTFKEHTGVEQAFTRNLGGSGAWFGGKNAHRANKVDEKDLNTGDIVCPMDFKFTIECKHYKTAPTLPSVLKGPIAQWDKWIGQVSSDANASGRDAMLIMKYNLSPISVVITEQSANEHFPTVPHTLRYTSKSGKVWMLYKLDELIINTLPEQWFNTTKE